MNEQLDSPVKRRRIMSRMKEPLGSAVKSHRIRARDSEPNTAQTCPTRFKLPLSFLMRIAQFSANPPAIYAFCMTSKFFFKRTAENDEFEATRFLREALLASLRRVFAYHRIPESAISFAALRGTNGVPAAVVSGSAMIQVVLGEIWDDSDVDIWCTQAALANVRTQFQAVGFILRRQRNENSEYEHPHNMLGPQLLPNRIDAVEKWDVPSSSCSEDKSEDDVGRNVDSKSGLDVIVAEDNCADPREMLDCFDIMLCAIYYDGETFHIPDPHLSFKRQSLLGRKSASLMYGFTDAVHKSFPGDSGQLRLFCQWRANSMEEVLMSPWWIFAVKTAIETCITYNGDVDRDHLHNIVSLLTNVPYFRYFEFFTRLFERQEKYRKRGIKIADYPPDSRLVQIPQISSRTCKKIAETLAQFRNLPMRYEPLQLLGPYQFSRGKFFIV